jgi:hypothetical protein
MNKEISPAEEFWLALARNDRAGAQEVVDRLDLPPIVTSPFSFDLVGEELKDRQECKPQRDATGGLSPKSVSPDTPVATVETWNAVDQVRLVLVSKTKICGARVSDGEVNFLSCAGALDHVGGTSCGWATHKTGGKDAKRHQVLKIYLPGGGVKAAIPIQSLGSAVKCPKIFSLPILPQASLPYKVLSSDWDEALTSLEL